MLTDDVLCCPWSRRLTWHRVKILGHGCYAKVYLALYTDHDEFYEEIAVKTAKLECAFTLQKETRILEDFYNCPEIVRCLGHEVTVEGGVQFHNLLLEYAPLGTLFDLIQRSRDLILPRDIRIYTWMILKGLCFMHAKGYVHCDLKPENILVFRSQDHGYQLKIADFGLAKEPRDTLSKRLLKYRFRGTPLYMSPESVALGEIKPALDIWSLGCVVLQMITGKPAWQYGAEYSNPKDIVYLLAFTKKTPRIPDYLAEIGKDFLRKCFERDHHKRWSAQMLLDHPYVSEASGLPVTQPVRPMQFNEDQDEGVGRNLRKDVSQPPTSLNLSNG